MNKDTKKMLIQFVGTICAIVLVLGGLMLLTKEGKVSDGQKFKEEYEALNNTVRKSDGQTYGTMNIPKDNPIKYTTAKEALEVLDSNSAIIYIGAPWCPWCRNAIPVLFDLAEKYEVENIYYIELDDIKSNYEVENGKLKQTSKGTDDYYALLDKLKDRLDDYVITDDDGKKYDTGEKRIFMPYVIAVRDGEVVGDKVGTVTLNSGQNKYDSLTQEQVEQLTKTYEKLYKLAYEEDEGTCTEGSCE